MNAMTALLTPRQQLSRKARLQAPHYDVFLSQALLDEELVLGVYTILTEDLGLTVFCDWVDSPLEDHSTTTPADAAFIKDRMHASTCLIFIDSEHAGTSSWMSWEIGWFHGAKRRVCILPVIRNEDDQYRGREFLGLYPAAEEDDRYVLRVPVPYSSLTRYYPPRRPIGLPTWMPLQVWSTLETLPECFLV